MNYKHITKLAYGRVKTKLIYTLFCSSILLSGCGGGDDVSRFSDDNIPSPVVDEITSGGDITPSAPGSDAATEEELQQLPDVSAGGRQFADPNVVVALRGSASAKAGATIVASNWRQLSGPAVEIPTPDQLESAIIVPDFQTESQLTFQLTVQDSAGRTNASTVTVFVSPVPAFARVSGGVINEVTQQAVFTVRLNAPQAMETSINYTTRDGTAEAGSDYQATEGVLVFAPGEVEQTVNVTIYDTNVEEGNEFFSLNISVLSEQSPSANSGNVLITNNPDSVAMTQNIAFTNVGPLVLTEGESSSNPIDPQTTPGTGDLSYSSSDDSIATVDQSGSVTAVGEGTATITATKAADPIFPLSVASYEVRVNSSLRPPAIDSISTAIVYQFNTAITPLSLMNNGDPIDSCSSSGLPTGLSVTALADGSACEVSGTPTVPQSPTQHTVTATNAAGSVDATITIEIPQIAPRLVSPTSSFTYVVNRAIPVLRFDNNGGPPANCTALANGLPAGLSVAITTDTFSCEISGTPTLATGVAEVYQINAANSLANSTGTVTITVAEAPPILEAPTAPLVYTINTPITPLTLNNTGGGSLTDCRASSLPRGLTISFAANDASCVISGTPTEIQASAAYTITAQGVAGSSSVDLDITVQDIVFTDSIDLPYNALSNPSVGIGLALSSGIARIDWNDGSPTVDATNQDLAQLRAAGFIRHTYTSTAAGNITISFSDGISSLIGIFGSSMPFVLDIFDSGPLAQANNLRELNFNSSLNQVRGSFSTLTSHHPNLEVLALSRGATLTGDVLDLPRNLTSLNLNISGNLTGALANMPRNLITLNIFNTPGDISGTTADFPPAVELVNLQSNNTINGNISAIPTSLRSMSISGQNEISGNVSEIPATLTQMNLNGVNIMAGNIEDLHPDVNSISINGRNQIAGNLDNIVNNTTINLSVSGLNQITGTTAGLPASVTSLTLGGQNTLSGNIQDFHSALVGLSLSGATMIVGGDITLMQSTTIRNVSISGSNTIFGDVANIPTSISSLTINGSNTLSGNIQDIHSNYFTFNVAGSNTIAGDLGLVQANSVSTFIVSGLNTIVNFATSPTWAPTRLIRFELQAGGSAAPGQPPIQGWDSATVDRFLIFLDTTITQTTQSSIARIIINRRFDSPRTQVSDAAVQSLTNKGYRTIITPTPPSVTVQ